MMVFLIINSAKVCLKIFVKTLKEEGSPYCASHFDAYDLERVAISSKLDGLKFKYPRNHAEH